MDEKVFKRCVNRVLFISTPVILLLLMGSVKLQVQHITSTVIVGIVGSLVAFLIQGNGRNYYTRLVIPGSFC